MIMNEMIQILFYGDQLLWETRENVFFAAVVVYDKKSSK